MPPPKDEDARRSGRAATRKTKPARRAPATRAEPKAAARGAAKASAPHAAPAKAPAKTAPAKKAARKTPSRAAASGAPGAPAAEARAPDAGAGVSSTAGSPPLSSAVSSMLGVEAPSPLALDRGRVGRLDLKFTHHDRIAHVEDPIWQDVSSLAVWGRTLFCTCDETASVERLILETSPTAAAGRAGRHDSFPLGQVFDLPDGPKGEMDIEGLAVSDGYLWVCGSHSLKRDKPKDGLKDLEGIDWDPNRGFLGRIPLIDRGSGVAEPVSRAKAHGDLPERRAAMLPMRKKPKTVIRKMLKTDPLIGPFIDLPCKENGFDVEGLAVRGMEVILGLRGPVLRGHAFLVRMKMKVTKKGRLKPRKLANGRRYALTALDLRGQGIRDLCWDGDRLLILSGAVSDHAALQSVFALSAEDLEKEILREDALPRLLDLDIRRGADNAEGLSVLGEGEEARLALVYDSPHNDRTDPEKATLTADLFRLQPR